MLAVFCFLLQGSWTTDKELTVFHLRSPNLPSWVRNIVVGCSAWPVGSAIVGQLSFVVLSSTQTDASAVNVSVSNALQLSWVCRASSGCYLLQLTAPVRGTRRGLDEGTPIAAPRGR